MSVLIKGMDMPRSCEECRAICSNGEGWRCGLIVPAMPPQRLSELRQYCPLVEVPTPHGRLIDADKLIVENDWITFRGGNNAYIKFSDVNYAPTVIEAEE